MNILILMAGSDKDFSEKGYPKYLLEIQNKTLVQRIFERLKLGIGKLGGSLSLGKE